MTTKLKSELQVKPVVSILVLAWNHGAFIRQTLESLVTQVFDHPYEILIGEDCSSDGTREITEEYQALYPTQVRLLASEKNLGMHINFARLWQSANSDLIAFCEGDDYWTDSGKIAKQAAFFDRHPECTLCGTLTEMQSLDMHGEWATTSIIKPSVIQETYTFKEMIPGYNFHFSSVMVRKSAVEFPEWFQSIYCVDRPLYLLAAQNGRAGLIPEVTSVYRVHQGGSWSSSSMEKKAAGSTHLFLTMRNYFDARYQKLFDRTLGNILWSYMADDLNNEKLESARKLYWNSVRYTPTEKIFFSMDVHARVLLRLYFHPIYNLLRRLSGK